MDCQTYLTLSAADQVKTPTPISCIPHFISNIVSFAIPFAGVAAVFFIVLAGIKFLTSGGDPIKVEEAKKSLTFAIIGLIIILLVFVFIKVFSHTFGLGDCKILGVDC